MLTGGIGAGINDWSAALHYSLIGLALGVLLPFVWSGLRLKPGAGRTLLLGVLAAASPIGSCPAASHI